MEEGEKKRRERGEKQGKQRYRKMVSSVEEREGQCARRVFLKLNFLNPFGDREVDREIEMCVCVCVCIHVYYMCVYIYKHAYIYIC